MGTPNGHIVIGQFAGPHGVRGEFKVRSFTEHPADIAAYGPLTTEVGGTLTLSLGREMKPGVFLARAKEVPDRTAAEGLKGQTLSVPRAVLPAPDEDEFYLDDLKGLAAFTPAGEPAGRVHAVVNYGADDLVEIREVPDRQGAVLVPFTRENVPEVDIAAGRITIVLPPEDDATSPPPDALG